MMVDEGLDTTELREDFPEGPKKVFFFPEMKEKGEPEKPWGEWLDKVLVSLVEKKEDPSIHHTVRLEIPLQDEMEIIKRRNRKIRGLVTKPGVFYRPGLGHGGLVHEILEKAGAFTTMIVTDPIYRENEMRRLGKLLPLEYYLRCLELVGGDSIEVRVGEDFKDLTDIREINEDEIGNAQIPKGGIGVLKFKLNDVEMQIFLLTEDMTKVYPERVDILGFGRPSPIDEETTNVYTILALDFRDRILERVREGGIVMYKPEGGFNFAPRILPLEAVGLRKVYREEEGRGSVIVQKVDSKRRGFEAEKTLQIALTAFCGNLPTEETWVYGCFLGDMYTEENIIEEFRKRLQEAKAIISSWPLDLQKRVIRRIKEVFRSPVEETSGGESVGRVFIYGVPRDLISIAKEGEINIAEYYSRLEEVVNEIF